MLNRLVTEAWRRLNPAPHQRKVEGGDTAQPLEQASRLLERGELGAAREICLSLLAGQPGLTDASNLLGEIAFRRREFAVAAEYFAQALAWAPCRADLHNNYGNAMAEQCRTEEAVAAFRRAVALDPRDRRAYSNLLWLMNMRPEFSAEERYLEHCRWAEACAEPLRIPGQEYTNRREPGRVLRIGYVSSDFRTHAVGYFIEPIIAHHDRKEFAVFCYSNSNVADAATERMRALCAEWRDIAGLSDEAADALVRKDRIDILIDLSGHTRGNRLLMFARQPAPVQLTFLGYPATTGMSAMHYRLTDELADPPGAERYYRERLYRLPRGLWCYQPRCEMPETGLLPALASGQTRFGSMNGAIKLNAGVIAAWSRILARVPAANLLLATVPRGEYEVHIREEFEKCGIEGVRLEFSDRLEPQEYTALFARIDIALDPFPCNGGTTTCESLWMGVPVVSLAGDEFRSRAGLSLLHAAGLPHLVAGSVDAYVDIAVELARDIPALAQMRAGLRDHVRDSPLGDIRAYVLALEEAYRAMWREWCGA